MRNSSNSNGTRSADSSTNKITQSYFSRLARAIEEHSQGRVTVRSFVDAPPDVAERIRNAGAAFVRNGDEYTIFLREGRPLSTFWHEFEHYQQWRQMLATDPSGLAYWVLPVIEREEHVFRAMFENSTIWRLKSRGERETQFASLRMNMISETTRGSAVRLRIENLIQAAEQQLDAPSFNWNQ